MHEFGFLSLLPPLLAIILAMRTRQVYLSLMAGIWLGWMILSDWNFIQGSLASIQALVDVFQDAGNTRTILFGALVGALITYIQRSGGVKGFILTIQNQIDQNQMRTEASRNRSISLITVITGFLIFVESTISVLTVGALYRPLFDRFRISREKLAYLADSCSAPSCILIPFNAWGAFIMGLLVAEGFSDPFRILLQSIPMNFYALFALALVFFVAWSGWHIGPMKKAEERVGSGGPLLPEGSVPMISQELTDMEAKPGVTPRSINMLVPLGTMVVMMPIMLAYTGWDVAVTQRAETAWIGKFFFAIGQGSGSTAVLIAVLTSIAVAAILYRSQGIFRLNELVDLAIKGISGLLPLAMLMMFAFAISSVCKELQTGVYVADMTGAWLHPGLVPLAVFLISGFIAFSTGTSWGTFAIMLTIAIPLARDLDAPMIMTISAVLGGGVFGDHSSPISDTTIISSMAAATDHIAHVRTQMPYALIAGFLASLFYLVAGWWSV